MANTTIKGAQSIHGQNPQFLVEYIIRSRIYESTYWKEHCFALTAESLIDKAISLKSIGGVYGNQKPTEFICLLLKLLQIQPEKEILVEYLLVDEFKYLRALAAMYIRMTFRAVDVYDLLEPLLKDYRKLRLRSMAGYSLTYMDEFVDELLTEERVCDIILPRIAKRETLEDTGDIGPRKSRLLEVMEWSQDSRKVEDRSSRSPSRNTSGSHSRGGSVVSDGNGGRMSHISSPSRTASRSISRSRSASPRFRSRSRSISLDRMDTNGE
ncbi:PRP38 family-domain-containing protein [Hysterangium stoloniferum]|nr:PRP38 family-domain-containing protein [Hysterangium stoloniferum]